MHLFGVFLGSTERPFFDHKGKAEFCFPCGFYPQSLPVMGIWWREETSSSSSLSSKEVTTSLKHRMWAQDGLIKEPELNTSFVSLLL